MEIFINNAINNGIINYFNYINGKELNKVHIYEFLIIKVLVCIYGEINIINPYKLNKPDSFKNNLLIYGIKISEINSFIDYMEEYDIWLNSSSNVSKTIIPNEISKILINMILLKSVNYEINKNDLEVFDSFFNPISGDMLKINELIIENNTVIPILWNRKRQHFKKDLVLTRILPELLSANDYNKYGLDIKEVEQLSNLKIKEINDKIIADEDESEGKEKFDPKKLILTSGSGFVDTIVLLSIMATEIMIGLLIAFWFLRR